MLETKGVRLATASPQRASHGQGVVTTGEHASHRSCPLRRLDWRFLLPLPPSGIFQRLALLGGSDDLARRITEVGLAREVSRTLPATPSADAVIVLHPARVAPKDVARSLAPGGVFYYEGETRPLPRHQHDLLGALRQAGLQVDNLFAVRPDFRRRETYIPLAAKGALTWYFQTLFTPATPVQNLLAPAVSALSHAPADLNPLATHVALTGTKGPRRPDDTDLVSHPALPEGLRRKPLHPLLISRGNDDNRVALFLFEPDAVRPAVVLKTGRRADRNQAIEDEQAGLSEMLPYLDQGLRCTIPQPLGSFRWGDLQIGVESCAPGRPMTALSPTTRFSSGRRVDDLNRVADWLTRFNGQAQPAQGAWDSARYAEWVERPLAAYQAAFGMTLGEERLFDRVRRQAYSLVGVSLPTVWVHWGFEERNILRHGQAIHVVDWEGASPGPPLYDLLYFVTRWSCSVRGLQGASAEQEGFRDLFLAPEASHIAIRAARRVMTEYMSHLGINRRFLAPLLVLTWVERAVGRFKQRPAARPDLARMDNSYVDYVDIIAEHVERIFDA